MSKRRRSVKVVRSDAAAEIGELRNVPGNHYDKHGSTNPIVIRMMDSFHARLTEMGRSVSHESVLDVGCGEGRTTTLLADALEPTTIVGCDLEVSAVADGPSNLPTGHFVAASIYELPFDDDAFDLVVATEVLEHLDAPEAALPELSRVARHACIITVPNEPWWRIGNMARGAYLAQFGNTPGHVQHWTTPGLRRFLEAHFDQVEVRTAAMWNTALIRLS
jgi:ubiquinone/menaquinone biosynthesis C-methylase UbiE